MSITQVHSPEIYDGAIFDNHVNEYANITGTKIEPGTTIRVGTIQFATDQEAVALKAVQANDTRLHLANTDTGTTSNSFIVNTDHSAGDNSSIVLYSSSAGDVGGAIRYNDTANRLEGTNSYNGIRTWESLLFDSTADYTLTGHINISTGHLRLPNSKDPAPGNGNVVWTGNNLEVYNSGDSLWKKIGGGLLWYTKRTGSQGLNYTAYTLNEGSFQLDGSNLQVFVNGQKKTNPEDYIIQSYNTIAFNAVRKSTDVIEMIVYSIGFNQEGHFQNTDLGTTSEVFRVGTLADEAGAIQRIAFGTGNTDGEVGLRNFFGTQQFKNIGGDWQNIGAGFNTYNDYVMHGHWTFANTLDIPIWTNSTRPQALARTVGFNSQLGVYEGYNGVDWVPFSAYSTDTNIGGDGSAGIIYRTRKTGQYSDDVARTIYSLFFGSFNTDDSNLLVFVNGQLKTAASSDYVIVDEDTIRFLSPRRIDDTIEMLVMRTTGNINDIGGLLYKRSQNGSQAVNPEITRFTVPGLFFSLDGSDLMVLVNGEKKSLYGGTDSDFFIVNSNTIEFRGTRSVDDVITFLIFSTTITSGGQYYVNSILGSESSNLPLRTIYTITDGSMALNGGNVMVFVNGQLKSIFGTPYPDFIIETIKTLEFTFGRYEDDVIEIVVVGTPDASSNKVDVTADYTMLGEWRFMNKRLCLPSWTTVGRPSAELASIGYNTDSGKVEWSNGTSWTYADDGKPFRYRLDGEDSNDYPTNSEYTVVGGSFEEDGSNLMVFVNKLLYAHDGINPDYDIVDSTTIRFNENLDNDDRIEFIILGL